MMILNEGHSPKRKEEFEMVRNNLRVMHDEHHEFLLCSFVHELCVALQCPEMVHGRKEPDRGE